MQLVYYANSDFLNSSHTEIVKPVLYWLCQAVLFFQKKKKKELSQNYPQKTMLRSCLTDKRIGPQNTAFYLVDKNLKG